MESGVPTGAGNDGLGIEQGGLILRVLGSPCGCAPALPVSVVPSRCSEGSQGPWSSKRKIIPFADLFDALHDLKRVLDVPRKDFVEHRPQKEEPGHKQRRLQSRVIISTAVRRRNVKGKSVAHFLEAEDFRG